MRLPKASVQTILAVFHDSGRAGAELVLLTHLRALQARGVRIVAVLPRSGALEAALQPVAERIHFHAAPWWIRLRGARTHARAWNEVARGGLGQRLEKSVTALQQIIAREQPDLVVTAASVLLSPTLAARRAKLPAVQFVHEWPGLEVNPAVEAWDSALPWPAALDLLRTLNHRLIWSSPACAVHWADPRDARDLDAAALQAAWQRRSGPGSPEAFLPHPLDLSSYPSGPRERRPAQLTAARPIRLAFVGTWNRRKGIATVHRILETLHADQVPFTAQIVGRQPGDAFTRQLRQAFARARWAAQVRIQPFAEDLPALLAQTDVLLHPAQEDTSPLILAHAMAAGVAILATDLPGIHEMLSGYRTGAVPCGMLVATPAEPLAFVKPIADSALLRKNTNPRRAMRLAREIFDQRQVCADFYRLLLQAKQAAQTTTSLKPASGEAAAWAALRQVRHPLRATLWAWQDETIDAGRGLLARMRTGAGG